jgi:hypothetical protein
MPLQRLDVQRRYAESPGRQRIAGDLTTGQAPRDFRFRRRERHAWIDPYAVMKMHPASAGRCDAAA